MCFKGGRFAALVFASGLAVGEGAWAGISFESEILPLFEAQCITCHRAPYIDEKTGRTRKPKGGFVIESLEHFKAGGDSGPVLVPGKPNESLLYELISRPRGDAEIMPPAKEGRLSTQQIALIKKWIEEGARFGRWVGRTDLKPPSNSRPPPIKLDQAAAFYAGLLGQGHEGASAAAMGSAQLPGVIISPVAENNALLRVTVVQGRKAFDAQALRKMAEIYPFITELGLRQTAVGEHAVRLAAYMPNLTRVDLSHTSISGSGLAALKDLKHLKSLNLYGTQVTDEAVEDLSELTGLTHLYVGNTPVSEAGEQLLKERLPNTQVVGDLVLPKEE